MIVSPLVYVCKINATGLAIGLANQKSQPFRVDLFVANSLVAGKLKTPA